MGTGYRHNGAFLCKTWALRQNGWKIPHCLYKTKFKGTLLWNVLTTGLILMSCKSTLYTQVDIQSRKIYMWHYFTPQTGNITCNQINTSLTNNPLDFIHLYHTVCVSSVTTYLVKKDWGVRTPAPISPQMATMGTSGSRATAASTDSWTLGSRHIPFSTGNSTWASLWKCWMVQPKV